ncbi:MAG TPA: MXAN_5187 family protein, partial [Myxococcaceae bacterium]|nr:MXAN_5187 family protein [Myxococcaceae bacterium]
MVRLKFFLFALLVLGLGLAHLPLLSGALSARAVEGASAEASAQASVALSEVARALEGRRLVLQGLALKLAASPEVAAAVQPRVETLRRGRGIRIVEPPIRERFAGMRAATGELVPEALKELVVLGLATEDAALYSRAGGKPSSEEALDVQAMVKAGSEGLVVEVFDAPHVFYAVPVLWSADGGRPQVAVNLVVGAPLVVEPSVLEAVAQQSGAAAIGLVKGETVVGAGPQKELAEEALQVVQGGQSGQVVKRGSVGALLAQLPVKLPILTGKADYLGGQSVLAVGSRRVLEGSPYELIAVASVVPFMRALAEYQQNALYALAGLLGFSLLWMLVMGSGGSAAKAPAAKQQQEKPKKEKKGRKGQQEEPAAEPAPVSAAAAILPEPPEPPEPSPDDFPFP